MKRILLIKNNLPGSYFTRKNIIESHISYYTILLIIVLIAFNYLVKDIDMKLAINGASPQDYVSQKMHPENYVQNFPNNSNIYDGSIVTYSYYFLKKYFDVDVSSSVKMMMLLQIILFVFSCSFFINTLFEKRLLTILSIIVIMLSGSAGLDLARFGNGYASFLSLPLFYGFATSLSLFALSFFIKNKFLYSFILLSLSVLCHQNISIFMFAFIMMYVVFNTDIIKNREFLTGFAIFAVFITLQIYTIISKFHVTAESISTDQWLLLTRMFCYHWYPFTMKSFTTNAYREFLPLIIIMIGFFVSLDPDHIKNEKHKKILLGLMACFIMTVSGIIISGYVPVPLLIKVTLHRSSGIITFISIVYIIHYIYNKIIAGAFIEILTALFFVHVLFNAAPGIALMPVLLFAIIDSNNGKIGPFIINERKKTIIQRIIYMISFIIIVIGLLNYFNPGLLDKYFTGILSSLQYINPASSIDFLIKGGTIRDNSIMKWYLIFPIIGIFGARADKILNYNAKYLIVVLMIPFLLFSMFVLYKNEYNSWEKKNYAVSKDFFNAQQWAKTNTPVDSLFMVDPSHYYGWRDFSERSSFGNLREWLWFPVAYIVNVEILNEGIKRAKEFNIDPLNNNFDNDFNKFNQSIVQQLRYNVYSYSTEQWRLLSKKYDIDYIILFRKRLRKSITLPIIYENTHFILYALNAKRDKDLISKWKSSYALLKKGKS